MPGDATHVKSAKYIAVIGGIILYGAGIDLITVIATAGLFIFGVMYLSPDLDYPGTQPMQRWGHMRICWTLFEKKIKHRSPWSHGWILGLLTIQVNFLLIIVVIVAFLRLCWLPLIEPMIVNANAVVDDLLVLKFSPEVLSFVTWYGLVALAAHWHHKILDTFLKN